MRKLVLVSSCLCASSIDAPLAPEAVKPLEQIAKDVAKAGRAQELDELLELARRAGMEAGPQEKLAAACRADAVKVKKPAPSVPAAAKSLQKIAATLAARLQTCDDPERSELARLILRLDDASEPAQRALGREKIGAEWLDAKARARRERRAAIDAAVAKARALDVAIEVGRSDNGFLARSKCKEPHFAKYGNLVVHGVWPAEKLERVLRQTLRAAALDRFLLTGELGLPTIAPSSVFIFFDDQPQYLDAIRFAHEKRFISDKDAADAQRLSADYVGNELVGYSLIESDLESFLHLRVTMEALWGGVANFTLDDAQPGLVAGLVNWSSLTVIGARAPVVAIEESKEQVRRVGTTASVGDEERTLREKLMLLAEAGISGSRAWMQYLAEHREDPPLAATLVDQVGRIQGDELLKATFVIEMLSDDESLMPFMKKIPDKRPGKTREQIVEEACGQPLTAFDAGWREWIVPPRVGLAERLGGAPIAAEKLTAAEHQVVDALNEIRHRASTDEPAVDFDRATSDSCRKHALYLAKNPDQLARWPDAHEEYPDRPAFDPAGAWAGTHSVIAPGVKDGREALDGWMATFYHRLPLLDPGLLRIGFALEGGTAVLDSGSFVKPRKTVGIDPERTSGGLASWWGVAWPPDGSSGMPTRFQAELPQPVPGEDESKMGYPITLQLLYQWVEARPQLTLVLHSGTAKGAEVACWISTPTAPTNPKLAPDDCWCLIPKSPLQPSATYTVTGEIELVGAKSLTDHFAWSFRCGK